MINIIFLKIPQLRKIIREMDDSFNLKERFLVTFETAKLLVMILSLANFCGCGFHLIAKIEEENNILNNWKTVKDF